MGKLLFIVVLSISLFAQSYTKEDRIRDMQTMADAMMQIETGFLYNNIDLIVSGTAQLSDTIIKVKPPLEEKEEQDPMTRYLNKKVQFTDKIVTKINKKSQTILERFQDGDAHQALQAYTKIMKACLECHTQVRHW